MKQILLIVSLLLISTSLYAKSYICRTDGSVVAFEDGEEVETIKPLRQNEIEEVPLPVPKKELTAKEKEERNRKSNFVPLTQEDIENRSR